MGANTQHWQDQPRAKAGVPGRPGAWVAEPKPHDTNLELSLGVGWDEIAPGPTEDQMVRAADAARRSLSWNGLTLSRAELNAKTDEFARKIAEQEAAFEAWKAGRDHPDDEMYDNIWDGLAVGTSKEIVEATLAVLKQTTPGDETERAQIEQETAMYKLALDCGGKNLSVNQANVVANKRVRDRVPF